MNNSIDTILSLLTDNNNVSDSLKKILTDTPTDNQKDKQIQQIVSDDKEDRLTLKINLMHAIIPFLSDKSKEYASFIIKILQIISLLQQSKTDNN